MHTQSLFRLQLSFARWLSYAIFLGSQKKTKKKKQLMMHVLWQGQGQTQTDTTNMSCHSYCMFVCLNWRAGQICIDASHLRLYSHLREWVLGHIMTSDKANGIFCFEVNSPHKHQECWLPALFGPRNQWSPFPMALGFPLSVVHTAEGMSEHWHRTIC